MKYRKLPKYKYQLTSSYNIQTNIVMNDDIWEDYIYLHKSGMMTIKEGYAWDGATGGIDTKNFMRGSLVHDALTQLIRLKRLPQCQRLNADKLLKQICLDDGMCKLRAWWVFKAVRAYVRIKYD